MNDSVESRLQSIEDTDAIRKLKALYCLYADQPGDDNALSFADLFTDDAVIDEGEELGILKGKQAIYKAHGDFWEHMRLNQHLVFSPVIELNGDKATGKWKLLQLTTTIFNDEDRAFWSCSYYNERYTRVHDEWKFERVEARVHFSSPYEDGWAKTPFGEFLPAEVLAKFTS